MVEYKYNSARLPAPPEMSASYPNVFVQYGDLGGGYAIYAMIAADAPGTMGESGYAVGEHTYNAWVVAANEKTAEDFNDAYPGMSTTAWLQYESRKTVTEYIYTNIVWSWHDILNEDGTVYMAGTDPVKVFVLKSFLTGLALGLCGKSPYIPHTVGQSYVWNEEAGTLAVFKDDGSLGYAFDESTFGLTVQENQ